MSDAEASEYLRDEDGGANVLGHVNAVWVSNTLCLLPLACLIPMRNVIA